MYQLSIGVNVAFKSYVSVALVILRENDFLIFCYSSCNIVLLSRANRVYLLQAVDARKNIKLTMKLMR